MARIWRQQTGAIVQVESSRHARRSSLLWRIFRVGALAAGVRKAMRHGIVSTVALVTAACSVTAAAAVVATAAAIAALTAPAGAASLTQGLAGHGIVVRPLLQPARRGHI